MNVSRPRSHVAIPAVPPGGRRDRVKVMHIVDSMTLGGAERVTVNLINLLPRDRFEVHLCLTRRGGPLLDLVADDVGVLHLRRKWRFDLKAVGTLVRYIRDHDVQIVHAHASSILVTALASLAYAAPKVIWHDHYGCKLEGRPVLPYQVLVRRVQAIIAVNQSLAGWSRDRLNVAPDRVHYVPNFVDLSQMQGDALPELGGVGGKRIVCVANMRPQKDHLTLLRAMERVVGRDPEAHLILVGAIIDRAYTEQILREISQRGLDRNVTFLGEREDVPAVLESCDIGVLSSASEGLPLALLEYGASGLAAVATRVGQCSEVLADGEAGLLVPPSDSNALAKALLSLLVSPARRTQLSERLHERVVQHYSPTSIIRRICDVYEVVLAEKQS